MNRVQEHRSHKLNYGRYSALAALLAVFFTALTVATTSQIASADGLFDFFTTQRSLEKVETGIADRFKDIGHIEPNELATHIANGDEVLILDVREPDEYQVSHLPGAIRIPPGMPTSELKAKLGSKIAGKKVVFYCSVGERSSRLAKAAKDELTAMGATGVENLRGGIFAWHNQSRPLVNAAGDTPYVHPFDNSWGRLVDRQKLTRMKPEVSPVPAP